LQALLALQEIDRDIFRAQREAETGSPRSARRGGAEIEKKAARLAEMRERTKLVRVPHRRSRT
jgi:hypothetical protein